jgi:hypothetical protein
MCNAMLCHCRYDSWVKELVLFASRMGMERQDSCIAFNDDLWRVCQSATAQLLAKPSAAAVRTLLLRLVTEGSPAKGIVESFIQATAVCRGRSQHELAPTHTIRTIVASLIHLLKSLAIANASDAAKLAADGAADAAAFEWLLPSSTVSLRELPPLIRELQPETAARAASIARNAAPMLQHLIQSAAALHACEDERSAHRTALCCLLQMCDSMRELTCGSGAVRAVPEQWVSSRQILAAADGESLIVNGVLFSFGVLGRVAQRLIQQLAEKTTELLAGVVDVPLAMKSARWVPSADRRQPPSVGNLITLAEPEAVFHILLRRAHEQFGAAERSDSGAATMSAVLQRWSRTHGDPLSVLIASALAFCGGGMARCPEVVAVKLQGGQFSRTSLFATTAGELLYQIDYSKSERVEDNGGVVRVAPPPLAQLLAIYVVYLRRFIEFATIVRTRFFHAFHHTHTYSIVHCLCASLPAACCCAADRRARHQSTTVSLSRRTRGICASRSGTTTTVLPTQ